MGVLKVWEFINYDDGTTFVGTIADYTKKYEISKKTLKNWIEKGKIERHYFCDADEYDGPKKGKLYWLMKDYLVNGVPGYGGK